MYCKYCGGVQDDDAIFCSKCGRRLTIAKNPDINSFSTNKNLAEPTKDTVVYETSNKANNNFAQNASSQSSTFAADIPLLTGAINSYSEVDCTPEFNSHNFFGMWNTLGFGKKAAMFVGYGSLITISALIMLAIFFPGINF